MTFPLFFFFILGTVVGSFLNVVILRFQTGKTIYGRSACFSCDKNLVWYELLPIVSFLALKGRCRSCRAKISMQYPLVEGLTGLTFLLTARSVSAMYLGQAPGPYFLPAVVYYLIVFCVLIFIFVYDIRHKVIPDASVYTFVILSAGALFLNTEGFVWKVPTAADILAGPLMFSFFFAIWFISKGRWVGLGDGKLSFGIGWFLGLERGLTALVLAFWIGAVVSVALIITGRILKNISPDIRLFRPLKSLTIKSEMPFAPFLVAGLWLVFFFKIGGLFPIEFLLL